MQDLLGIVSVLSGLVAGAFAHMAARRRPRSVRRRWFAVGLLVVGGVIALAARP